MENTGTDDVGRLLLQLNLDVSRYKVFRDKSSTLPLETALDSSPPAAEAVEVPQEPAPAPPAEVVERITSSEAVVPSSLEALAKAVASRPHPPPQVRNWTLLASLFRPGAFQSAERSPARRADPLELSETAVFGVCGGVGTTTIVTALGKVSAKSGRRVLLVDVATPSLLPLHFGSQSPRSQISTFVPAAHAQEGPIHVACGSVDESVRALKTEIDCVYVDRGRFRRVDDSPLQSGGGISILVLIPDTRCIFELNRLEEHGINVSYLLLNQFDERQPLHQEIQYRLAKQFNERLIPVTINHDPDVSAALLQGTTIIDYAPSSSVTKDLYKVNEWLTARSAKLPEREPALAGRRL